MSADHGRSRCWSASGHAEQLGDDRDRQRLGEVGDEVERRPGRRGVEQLRRRARLHPRPQPLDVTAGERLRDQRAQPGVLRRLVLHHLVAVQPVERLELGRPAPCRCHSRPNRRSRSTALARGVGEREPLTGRLVPEHRRRLPQPGERGVRVVDEARLGEVEIGVGARATSPRHSRCWRGSGRRHPPIRAGAGAGTAGPAPPRRRAGAGLVLRRRCAALAVTGPGVVSRCTVASPSRRCSGPWLSRTLCTFSCGTTSVSRRSRPRRVTSTRSSAPTPSRRQANGSSQRAAARHAGRAARRRRRRRAAPCASTAQRLGARCHRAAAPTRSAWPSPTYPATLTSTRHQPCDRHSSGSTIRTACTRPGGTVCARVSSSPCRSRRPSGDSATVKPKCATTALHRRPARHRTANGTTRRQHATTRRSPP